MTGSEERPTATNAQIDAEIANIRDYLYDLADQTSANLLWFLIYRDRAFPKRKDHVNQICFDYLDWETAGGTARSSKISVKDHCLKNITREPKKYTRELSRIRTNLFVKLQKKLFGYYQQDLDARFHPLTHPDLPPRQGKTDWVLHIEFPKDEDRTSQYKPKWKPVTEFRTREEINTAAPHTGRYYLERIGTNEDAMEYLADQISRKNLVKIEDTAIRWDVAKLPYAAPTRFKEALKQRKTLEYILLTGPVRDKSYMEAIREAYWDKPDDLICHRLDRSSPILNFVILYYLNRDKDLKAREVLFGYGTRQETNLLGDTHVFRTNHPDLILEYKRLFREFLAEPSSEKIKITDPDFAHSDETDCDVLATVENFATVPVDTILRRELSGGIANINICFLPTDELKRLLVCLKPIDTNAPIKVLLPHQTSDFMKLRERSLLYSLKGRVKHDVDLLKSFLQGKNVEVRSTHDPLPLMFVQIGNRVIFSAFWHRLNAAKGPQCILRTSSDMGGFLKNHFKDLWDSPGTKPVNLGKISPSPSSSRKVVKKTSRRRS